MNIVIIGGAAAGTKAAVKLERENQNAHVTILTKSIDISYAGCRIPYYVCSKIVSRDQLIVNTPTNYSSLTGTSVKIGFEVTAIDPETKTVTGTDLSSGESVHIVYDELIIATGAQPVIPNIEGTDLAGVFCMRTPDDASGFRSYVEQNKCCNVVVAGAGFIGLEVAEILKDIGLEVTIIDAANQILPNIFDRELADFAKRKLKEAGIRVMPNTTIETINGDGKAQSVQTSSGKLAADMVILAAGVHPATDFLKNSGLTMDNGAIIVDAYMRTNLPHVYAVGDCAIVKNHVTGTPQWSAMGSTENLCARLLVKHLTGSNQGYSGCLNTYVVQLLPNLNAGRTDLTLQQARDAGFDAESIVYVTDDKTHYYTVASSFVIKLIAERETRKLLGLQVLGTGTVDKIVVTPTQNYWRAA